MPSDINDIDPGSIDTGAADAIAADFFSRGGQPALSYGIVAGGRLVHSAGFGARSAGGIAPDADTVFRIASMSKSFTAAAVLLARDAGLLALDDPAGKYVPELAVSPEPVTIRNLLTMSAGFPTDDPWGDRQQGLGFAEFGDLLADGARSNWAPGTRFEYSNLGYAVLGRVITAATGTEYAEFVRTRLLEPLGLTRTGYAAEEFGGVSAPAGAPVVAEPPDDANLAQGYRRGPDGWEPVPFEPHGAFAPMGGVFSTVRDLAAWVQGFSGVFPPGSGGSDAHPLSAASRREMQLPQAVTAWRLPDRLPGGGAGAPAYYGFGLFVDEDPALGRIVNHSGGYPGFGSNMRWHPASGIGVIALGNGTYCGTSQLTGLILPALVSSSPARHVALAPSGGPWPETVQAQEAVTGLLASWDDSAADELFAENVAWDAPYAERRHAIGLVRERIGDFTVDESRPAESDAPAQRRWWLTGPRGTVQVQIMMHPGRPPKVQSLTLAIPPEPGGPLEAALAEIVKWLNSGASDRPASVPVAEGADVTLLTRRLRMAAAWAGQCRPGVFRAGDGSAFANVELVGEYATVGLALSVDPSTGELRAADVTL
ncbi:MAG: beta-lactamase family protein [Streptosporangiales bacterium]|nr:beta-lactamase family protein [Streptosporangiales bacterium]